MTDPIRIPIHAPRIDAHGDRYEVIDSYATVTTDLARQIVAIAGIPRLDTDFIISTCERIEALEHWQKIQSGFIVPPTADKPQPVADDAAMESLMRLPLLWDAGGRVRTPFTDEAQRILAAIRAGKVPGVCCDNDPNSLARRLAARCAVLEGLLKSHGIEVPNE